MADNPKISQIKLPNGSTYDIKDEVSGYIVKTATTATLTTTWSSNSQTVTVNGVTASNTVIVTPAPTSYEAYCEAGIYCSTQTTNSLTFVCDEVPSSQLTVNVLILS